MKRGGVEGRNRHTSHALLRLSEMNESTSREPAANRLLRASFAIGGAVAAFIPILSYLVGHRSIYNVVLAAALVPLGVALMWIGFAGVGFRKQAALVRQR